MDPHEKDTEHAQLGSGEDIDWREYESVAPPCPYCVSLTEERLFH